jgi:hypothetical protein
VVDPLNPRVETPEEIMDALLTASEYIASDQLGATDDCRFSPFSIDVKPKHGSPDFARDIAFQKIANRIRGLLWLANSWVSEGSVSEGAYRRAVKYMNDLYRPRPLAEPDP